MTRVAPPTVLAVPAERADETVTAIGSVPTVRTLLLLGFPTPAQRAAATVALREAGARDDAVVLAVHAPADARLLWGECRQAGASAGLHTYPDLEVIQVVDPDTGESEGTGDAPAAGELVLTQLGMRGSSLLRWRTGDVIGGIDASPCPGCGRVVPRVLGVQPAALVPRIGASNRLDVRAVANVLLGRDDLVDWRIVIGPATRDSEASVEVHVVPRRRSRGLTNSVRGDVLTAAGVAATRVVASDELQLAALPGTPISPHLLLAD